MLNNNEFYCKIIKNDKKRLPKDYQTTTYITTKEVEFLTDTDFRESLFQTFLRYINQKQLQMPSKRKVIHT